MGFSQAGLRALQRFVSINDVHGLTVYASDPKPQFVEFKACGVIGKNHNSFKDTLADAIALGRSLTEHERVSFHLFSASFFQPTADGRFLLLVMAVEALIEPVRKSAEAVAYVHRFMQQIEDSPLEEHEKDSLTGSLRWLRDESRRAGGWRAPD